MKKEVLFKIGDTGSSPGLVPIKSPEIIGTWADGKYTPYKNSIWQRLLDWIFTIEDDNDENYPDVPVHDRL